MTKEEAERLAREWLSERWVLTALELEERDINSLAALLLRVAGEATDAAIGAYEASAAVCEQARPHGGRAWTEGQAACFEALSFVADQLRHAADLLRAASSGEKGGGR